MVRPRRAALLVAGTTLALSGCGSALDPEPIGGESSEASSTNVPVPLDSLGEKEVASALDDRFDESFPPPLIDPEDLMSGGPPPDGIPPIDDPTFETAEDVDWLDASEPVLSLTVGSETRAYPLRVMTWHEIVNDTVGGVPVTVTYCPLCNSGVAFERELSGRLLTFGTSGLLYADNLVMYDRLTESLWPQLTGQASIGALTGTQLVSIPMGTVAWGDFRTDNPQARVLSQDTGFDRSYGTNPYVGYDDPDGDVYFALPGDPDDRLPVKARVIGLSAGERHVAVVRQQLLDQPPLEVRVGDRAVVLWLEPGQSSALDERQISEGSDIGTVGVFSPRLDGRRLHFVSVGDEVRDRETGSTWNVLGRATSGPLEGGRLQTYQHLDTFWFAWAQFHSDTDLVDSQDQGS